MRIKRRTTSVDWKALLTIVCVFFVLTFIWSAIQATSKEMLSVSNKIENVYTSEDIEIEEESFDSFLNAYARDGYTILLSSYDDMEYNIDSARHWLSELGSKYLDSIKFRDSYAGVIKDGKLIKEELSSDSIVRIQYDNFLIHGLGKGKKRNLNSIGGIFYVPDYTSKRTPLIGKKAPRGLNVVAFRNNDEYVREMVVYYFDLHAKKNPKSKGIKKKFPDPLDKLTIEIEEKHFNKIKNKREEALNLRILLTDDKDWVSAKIGYQGKEYKGEIRLKGDWTDHLKHKNKWSYKVKLNQGTIKGTNGFSVHTAAARNYLGEWMFHEMLRKGDVITLKYTFLNVTLKVRGGENVVYNDMGVMAFEESFTKYLLENNGRKESVILKVDESLGWEDYQRGGRNFHDPSLPITAFGLGKILKDKLLYNQFLQAKDMLHSYYRSNMIDPSSIFDYDKFAYWDAVATFTAGTHGHALHNRRFYYNPITSLLEPIGFDALGYFYVGKPFEVSYSFPEDREYRNLVLSKLHVLSQTMDSTEIKKLFEQDKFYMISEMLSKEYPNEVNRIKSLMRKRIEKINSIYGLNHPLDIYLEDIDKDSVTLNFRNNAELDLEILGLRYKKKPLINMSGGLYVESASSITRSLNLVEGGFNTFFSKKLEGVDRSRFRDIIVNYRIGGSPEIKQEILIPYPHHDSKYVQQDIMRKNLDLEKIPFIKVDETLKTVNFVESSSTWILDTPLKIEKGYKVIVPKNFNLDIRQEGLIVSKSPVFFQGEEDAPIHIFSSDKKGGGMIVLQNEEESEIKHTVFEKLSNPRYGKWALTGAVTFYESPVDLDNVTFKDNFSEDALNIVRSKFNMGNTSFYNTQSDAFDGDFVYGRVSGCYFENLGNDAVDVSGSEILIQNTEVVNAGDKAISIGEKSMAEVHGVSVTNSEIAINTKDLSITNIKDLTVKNTSLAFTAFQKKEEYGPGKIVVENTSMVNVETLHLIEENSSLAIDGKEIKEKVKEVKERMYGNEYGRKSER